MNKKINNKKIIIIAIIAILVILVAIKLIDTNFQTKESTNITNALFSIEENETEEEEVIIIYITGEVQQEGVIELATGSRIADAIEKAGGVTENANLKNVNLAYELEDGQKIYIPNTSEEETIIVDDSTEGIDETNEDETININKADSNELQNLNGIGVSLAQSIIEYREENGKFETIEEILNVPGIGESKYANIKDYIKVK